MRLDAALGFLLPRLGLRGRRRLWGWRRITVNGCPRPPGFVVSRGDLIRVESVLDRTGHDRDGGSFCARKTGATPGEPGAGLRLVAVSGDFAALHKPAGLHSAQLEGGRDPSLEGLLAANWMRLQRESGLSVPSSDSPPPMLLLTRLDAATSGIILAAMNGQAAERFRLAEQRREVHKTYFAVLRGRLLHPLVVRNRLDTNKRRLTRVLDEDDPDSARHTLVTPLADVVLDEAVGPKNVPAGEGARMDVATLACVRILRGARHQIRAHLAWVGFPLAGEWLYPVPLAHGSGMRLYLHHAKVEFSEFSALDMPDWNLGERIGTEQRD